MKDLDNFNKSNESDSPFRSYYAELDPVDFIDHSYSQVLPQLPVLSHPSSQQTSSHQQWLQPSLSPSLQPSISPSLQPSPHKSNHQSQICYINENQDSKDSFSFEKTNCSKKFKGKRLGIVHFEGRTCVFCFTNILIL